MDEDRLGRALSSSLSLYLRKNDPEDADDVIQFLVSECLDSGVELPVPPLEDTDVDTASFIEERRETLTLEEVLSHPITSILEPHLVDLLQVPPTEIPLVIDEFLDVYWQGVPDATDEDYASSRSNAVDKVCELCERPATLTEHHLLPRTEHALLIKRGLATLNDCRTRIAMLCRPCHSAVHRAKTTRELATDFNTVDKLLEVEEVAKFAEWNSKRKVTRTVVRPKRRG